MIMSQYQAGYRDGYADGQAGRPWLPDAAPGSTYSAGYRHGRQDAAIDAASLAALPA